MPTMPLGISWTICRRSLSITPRFSSWRGSGSDRRTAKLTRNAANRIERGVNAMHHFLLPLLLLVAQPDAPLDGVWKLLSVEMHGEVQKTSEPRFVWVIKKNEIHYGGSLFAQITVDRSTTPHSIDFACT